MENNIAFLARHKHETSFVRFVLLMLSQPAFLISLMVVDEQFSLLEHFVNLNTTYYYVPLIGRVDVWDSWEACFVILLSVYEFVFIWSLWTAIKYYNPKYSTSDKETDAEEP
ncbi:MAG: hypothetical protein JRN15_06015 [Nitrososphaerota archaeon]|nr:hypothetical protein [Nitrososphaerota archaeon]